MIDAAWHDDATRIYGNYQIYHQARGAEQSVFEQSSGQATARSDRLLTQFQKHIPVPETGRLLDFGCGNGALLRAFGQRWPKWSMTGLEVNNRYRSIVESIPGVEQFLTGSLADVPGSYQLITLVHVLEHIPFPRPFIETLRTKLDTDGLVLVEVPDCEQNPFMLMIADHATHFYCAALGRLVESSGFRLVEASTSWVSKEISLVARKADTGSGLRRGGKADAYAEFERRVRWLESMTGHCREIRRRGKFGIFGTSIAATWLFAELEGDLDFFVDEDANRIGGFHLERPILSPAEVPEQSHVWVALPPVLAAEVAARLGNFPINWHVPASLP